jgi:Gpi18-like mannosyltransferase
MPQPTTQPRPPYFTLLLQFFASRLLIVMIAAFALLILKRADDTPLGLNPLNWFFKWDSVWYHGIAHSGYEYRPNERCNVIFLPLFPLLMKGCSLFGIDLRVAGYLVSNVCFFVGAIFLWKLARLDSDDDRAPGLATQFLFFGPVSFFFSIVYSEATFFLCLVLALYHARRGRWLVAGICGYGAALTRSVGLLVIIAFVIEFWLQERKTFAWRRAGDWLKLACCGLPALGTLTYMAYLGWKFGEPLAYRKVEIYWGREFTWVWDTFTNDNARNLPPFYRLYFTGAAAVALILLLIGLKQRLRVSLLALGAAYLLLYTSVNLLEAMPRYLSVVVPLYLVAGTFMARHARLQPIATAFCSALLTFATVLFVGGYWFT